VAYHKIICGHILDALKTIPNESINCVITSPPYWGLRKYPDAAIRVWDEDKNCDHEWKNGMKKQVGGGPVSPEWQRTGREHTRIDFPYRECEKCGAWEGQLGHEPNPEMFIRHLCDIFDEIKRVLRKDGTCWVNISDCYRDRCLCLIPFKFVTEMVNRGWILRNTIIWYKPNPLPESVKNRFSTDFEYLFFFVKSKKYYFDQPMCPLAETTVKRSFSPFYPDNERAVYWREQQVGKGRDSQTFNQEVFAKIAKGEKLYRNMRCVWEIPIRPTPFIHFAVFPEALVETPIKAGCPQYICKRCDKPREPIYKTEKLVEMLEKTDLEYDTKYVEELTGQSLQGFIRCQTIAKERCSSRDVAVKLFPDNPKLQQEFINFVHDHPAVRKRKLIGYEDCECGAGFRNGVVLDPFAGSGTVAIVAERLGRDSISIEVVPEYCEMIKKRFEPLIKQKRLFEECIVEEETL